MHTVVDSSDRNRRQDYNPPDEFTEDEVEAITDFLSKSGGLMLVAELYESPKRFITLDEEMGVSSATIRNRMKDARELELLYGEDRPSFDGNGNRIHPLTPKGEVVAAEIQITDLARIQQEIWNLQDEFDETLTEFEGELKQQTPELNEALANRLKETF